MSGGGDGGGAGFDCQGHVVVVLHKTSCDDWHVEMLCRHADDALRDAWQDFDEVRLAVLCVLQAGFEC